jgi:hypothetical protein
VAVKDWPSVNRAVVAVLGGHCVQMRADEYREYEHDEYDVENDHGNRHIVSLTWME